MEEKSQVLNGKKVNDILPINKATEEEFANFMHRVTQVESIVKKLSSSKTEDHELGQLLADEFLKTKINVDENEELRVINSRTVINKSLDNEPKDSNEMSKEVFMKSVEDDAKKRFENRKIRNEHAETYKKIGNSAFRKENYEKAITYFGKAIDQRKDSTLLWNNRALSYMKLQLYEKALEDCNWALKINESNVKALLNSAKCHHYLNNTDKCQQFLCFAKERNPEHLSFIEEFEEKLYTNIEESAS